MRHSVAVVFDDVSRRGCRDNFGAAEAARATIGQRNSANDNRTKITSP